MIRPWQSADHAAARNLPRPSPATTRIHTGTSCSCVDLWYVDLDATAEALSGLQSWLADDELARARRFRSAPARTRYMAGRAALRGVLGERLGCSPAAVRFSYGMHGKPMLAGAAGHLDFSLAHSEGEAVIALAMGASVGVDLELLRPIAGVGSLACLVFSDLERRELEVAPDPGLAFLNGWTRKEAYVKALGLGLTAPLQEISVSLSGKAALLETGLRAQSVSDWRLFTLMHPRAVAALAVGPAPAAPESLSH